MSGAISLTEVDFEEIRQNLISYLKSTNRFTDYDFDGSNLNVILSLIAYQAQLNSYSTNMVANESFLATSSIRKNVVNNARQVGYTPISTTSANNLISYEVDLKLGGDLDKTYPGGLPQFVEMRAGNFFTTTAGTGAYNFNILDTVTSAVDGDGVATFTNVRIYEGQYITKNITVDKTDPHQRFTLLNEDVDTSSLRIEVKEDTNSDDTYFYDKASNLTMIGPEDRVYWVEEVEEGYYELTFGDGVFGKPLVDKAEIQAAYLVSSGEVANGVKGLDLYSYRGTINDSNGGAVRVRPNIIASTVSSGGADRETVPEIKFKAPKSFAAQNRCVTAKDYEVIIRQIYPAIEDMYVYGGEELTIPEYGRVYVVIKPNSSDYLTNAAKKQIKDELNNFRVASLDIILQDPEVLYIEAESIAYYDEQKTQKNSTGIISDIKSYLTKFVDESIDSRFGGTIKYSRIVGAIDDSDNSITRNVTNLRMRRNVLIPTDTSASYEVCFENPILNIGNDSSVYSTGFMFPGSNEIYYFEDNPEERGLIRLFHFSEKNEKVIDNKNFGTVDYEQGEVFLGQNAPFTIASTIVPGSIVEVRAYPKSVGYDITANKTIYLKFDVSKSDIGAVVESGAGAS